ncbi:MAG TPA: YggS family pyridoxal phosphate-dependent enzyme [Candidatus Acidoferrales bacterium]|nr:YggS family pyridoxal phosphate-dependent enzyme [Candidatus Acidoferrales bacterium]
MTEPRWQSAAIPSNLSLARERIARAAERSGRAASEIALIAVSKTFPAEAIRAAFEAGQRDFGENRVQEFESKREKLADLPARWRLIGHLQSNKARRAAHLFHSVDSLDSLDLARRLDAAAQGEGKRLAVLIEVHLSAESSKTGVSESDLPALAEAVLALPHLDLRGLMAIPPFFDDPQRARPHFRRLRKLRDDLSRRLARPLPALSMGMSHDFEVAIEEGSSEVRLGTAIFGQRTPRP